MQAAGGSHSLCLTHSWCIGNISKFLTLKINNLSFEILFSVLA